jgi:hypothetical protein
MKKSELKALILECKQELAEESSYKDTNVKGIGNEGMGRRGSYDVNASLKNDGLSISFGNSIIEFDANATEAIKDMLVEARSDIAEESRSDEFVVATNSDYYRVITAAEFKEFGYGWYTPYKGTESECRDWIKDNGKVIQE